MLKSELMSSERFERYFYLAIGLHVAVIIVFVLSSFLMDLNFFSSKIKKKNIKLVESSVRVDVVALPKLTLKELKNIDLRQNSAAEEKPSTKSNETSDVEFKKKAKKVNLSKLLKSFGQKKIDKKVKKKNKNVRFDKSALKKLVLEGNQLSQGSSLSGEQLDVSEKIFVNYIQQLPDRVKPFWKLPSYLLDKNLQCRIQVYIGADGKVLRLNIFESSGDKEYDDKALSSVKLSSPFPKPPSSILSKLTAGEVILGFPL